MTDENNEKKGLEKEIEALKQQIQEYKKEAEKAKELKDKEYVDLIKKVQSQESNSSKNIFSAVYLILIYILIFFAIAFEIFSSYNFRKSQEEMAESIKSSNARINNLNTYIKALDEDLQIIPGILAENFSHVKTQTQKQFRKFEHISDKSMESLEKVNELGNKSEKLMDKLSQVDTNSDQSIKKMKVLENKSDQSITKIEKIESSATENAKNMDVLLKQEQMDMILAFMKKYKSDFSQYSTKNDLSLLYKVVLVDEIGNMDYQVVIDAFRKYKFKNYSPPDVPTLEEWDRNLVQLCDNAINFIQEKRDMKESVKQRDRYFDKFKAYNDYTDYKRWGYFATTINYADLLTFYKNTRNSVQSRMEFNKGSITQK